MKTLALMLLAWVVGMSSTYASTYDTFAPESDTRSAVATVDFIEANRKGFFPFQVELEKNRKLGWGDVLAARENGTLVEYECDDCVCETAGLLPNGAVRYHRFLESKERVAVIGDKEVFVVKCGNPLKCSKAPWMKPKIIPPAPPPSPPPPPTVVEKKPEPQKEGCTDGTVQYSPGYWENPGTYGIWSGSTNGSYSWVQSHHDGVVCTWIPND